MSIIICSVISFSGWRIYSLIILHVKLLYRWNCPFPILQHAFLRWDRSGTNLLVVFKMSLHLRFIKLQNDASHIASLFWFFLIIFTILFPFLANMHLFMLNLVHPLVTQYCDGLLQYFTASFCLYYPEKFGIKWNIIISLPLTLIIFQYITSGWFHYNPCESPLIISTLFATSVYSPHSFFTHVNNSFLIP